MSARCGETVGVASKCQCPSKSAGERARESEPARVGLVIEWQSVHPGHDAASNDKDGERRKTAPRSVINSPGNRYVHELFIPENRTRRKKSEELARVCIGED